MKKNRFEDIAIFSQDSVIQLFGTWYTSLQPGTVLLVRSNNVPILGDHFIVVTGGLVQKEHGLRPQTLTISAPGSKSIIDSFPTENGSTVLMLKPFIQKLFLDYHNISVEGSNVRYSSLLVVEEILNVFDKFRMQPSSIDKYDSVGKSVLSKRFMKFIDNKEPIRFSMLGYPFKSSNTRDKVIGHLPDAAEEKSFENFANFGRVIKQVYTPGAEFHIISDGYIFSDVFGVPDNVVQEYNDLTRDFAKQSHAPIVMYDGTDFYGKGSPEYMREKVLMEYGISHEELTTRIMTDLNVNELYLGMKIFMKEEEALKDFPSGSQREKHAKVLAREAMIRNESYSALIRANFTDHIRLSMHNSTNDGEKYSIRLLDGNSKYSPWHSALAYNKDGSFQTMHRKDAEAAGMELVSVNNRPYYFQEI